MIGLGSAARASGSHTLAALLVKFPSCKEFLRVKRQNKSLDESRDISISIG